MPERGAHRDPGDQLHDCGCVLDFIAEALLQERPWGAGIALSDRAAQGLCVILGDVAATVGAAGGLQAADKA